MRQLAIKRSSSFPPHPTSVPALPEEIITNEILAYILPKVVLLLNLNNAQKTFCLHFWCFDWHFT